MTNSIVTSVKPDAVADRHKLRLAWARKATGHTALRLCIASSDASFRSYWRTTGLSASYIVMDSLPALEDPVPWLDIGARLRRIGVHVPTVYQADITQGFLLIEDLGDRLYLHELNDHSAHGLYTAAMDVLLRMQRDADIQGLAHYDRAFLQRELALMPEWFLDRHLQVKLSRTEQALLQQVFEVLLDNAEVQPQRFVHRDFHSRNLLVQPPDTTVEKNLLHTPGVIDFQGALIGPITYDLASLLRDCYIAWSDTHIDRWVETYRERLHATGLINHAVDSHCFRRWFDLTGLQRHLKVLGLFCRLCYRDGKSTYLADLPRVYAYVMRVARQYPELSTLAILFEKYVKQ